MGTRFRRGTATYANQGEVDLQDRSHPRTLKLPVGMVVPSGRDEVSPVFPAQRQVPSVPNIPSNSASQFPHSNNEQECVDVMGNLTQETVPPDQATQSITRLSSVIGGRLHDPRPLSPGNNDEQITEVPREAELVMVCALY